MWGDKQAVVSAKVVESREFSAPWPYQYAVNVNEKHVVAEFTDVSFRLFSPLRSFCTKLPSTMPILGSGIRTTYS